MALLTWSSSVYANGGRGNLEVRPINAAPTIDGDLSDWPLAAYDSAGALPDFPAGQGANAVSGDHLIFDRAKIGNFNGTPTDTGWIDDATDGSDMSGGLYFAYTSSALYIAEIRIDNSVYDDADLCGNFQTDGFEIFFDGNNDSTGCAYVGAVGKEVIPYTDDLQLTWGVNSLAPAGARMHYERGGENSTQRGVDCNLGAFRTYVDANTTGNSEAFAAYADMSASGVPASVLEEIAAPLGAATTNPGYIMECCLPFGWGATGAFDPSVNSVWGMTMFWRDRDVAPAVGWGWGNYHQQTGVTCDAAELEAIFNIDSYGTMTFGSRDLTVAPRSTLEARRYAGAPLTVDGDPSDWPLDQFDSAAVLPDFPGAQGAFNLATGDHIIFDRNKIGNFNGTPTDTGWIDDATDGSDMAGGIYPMWTADALYLLEIRIDNSVHDDADLCGNFQTDGFEIFFDANNDSGTCAYAGATGIEIPPHADDIQLTWGVNSLAPAGARLHYERGGESSTQRGGDCNLGAFRTYVDANTAGDSEAFAAYADMSASGVPASVLAEIAAPLGAPVTSPGYIMECCLPFGWGATGAFDPVTNPTWAWTLFWRDRDVAPAVGWGWGNYHQQTAVTCDGGEIEAIFNPVSYGDLVYSNRLLRGPRGTLEVRPWAGITVDGDLSDWPLDQFDTLHELPDSPGALTATELNVSGDHIRFDRNKIGNFNGTPTDTGWIDDATDGSDMSAGMYFVYDSNALYIAEIRIDNSVYDDADLCGNFQTDGFEFVFDANNDTSTCSAAGATYFEVPPYQDDLQLTWGVNSLAPAGARLHYERGGERSTQRGGDCNLGAFRTYVDANTAGDSEAFAAYADMSASGVPASVLAEIAAPLGAPVTSPGYIMECCLPFGWGATGAFDPVTNPTWAWSMFWRDRDVAPAVGWGWGNYHQQPLVTCDGGEIDAIFNPASYGDMVFSNRGFLVDPRNVLEVRPIGGAGSGSGGGVTIVVDGDPSEWPLDQFDTPAELPLFPGGQGPGQPGGDHIIFDRSQIGNFNGTPTDTGWIDDATDGSDMSAGLYLLYDLTALYILEVRIDNSVYDDAPLCGNFQTDGFEIFFDGNNDSSGCATTGATFLETAPYVDDLQLTWGVNSLSASGARLHYERGGESSTQRGGDCNLGAFRAYVDANTAGDSEAVARYADMSTSGVPASVLAEIAAPLGAPVTSPGYIMECCLPFGWGATGAFDPVTNPTWGMTLFWRDRDVAPAVGWGWGNYHQQTGVTCDSGELEAIFNTSSWGDIQFSSRGFVFGVNILPGDANQDGSRDLSDVIAYLQWYFNGSALPAPAGSEDCFATATGGSPAFVTTAVGLSVLDWNGDSVLDVSDAVAQLAYTIVGGGTEHAMGGACVLFQSDDCLETCP